MTCRHNIEHVGCRSCQQWRARHNQQVAERQYARFDSHNPLMQHYLRRRYPVGVVG